MAGESPSAPHAVRARVSEQVDQWHGHFWMYVCYGAKRWTLFHPEDTPFLYPSWEHGGLSPQFPSLAALEADPATYAGCLSHRRRRRLNRPPPPVTAATAPSRRTPRPSHSSHAPPPVAAAPPASPPTPHPPVTTHPPPLPSMRKAHTMHTSPAALSAGGGRCATHA